VRGTLEDLQPPVSLADGMPSLLLGSDLAESLIESFDVLLAPVFAAIDNFDCYLDPALTPQDFLPWLAGWVGVLINERWSEERQRGFAARAVELYLWRGTARGIATAVEVYAGVRPEIEESGATGWGRQPGGEIPGEDTPRLVVRLPASDAVEVDEDSLSRIVADAKPAHVPHTVELVRRRRSRSQT
jgi:phage tail-like protein